jgi:hypothetical protein
MIKIYNIKPTSEPGESCFFYNGKKNTFKELIYNLTKKNLTENEAVKIIIQSNDSNKHN